jgi:hypothetical protein
MGNFDIELVDPGSDFNIDFDGGGGPTPSEWMQHVAIF